MKYISFVSTSAYVHAKLSIKVCGIMDNFGVTVVILRGGANSGQASIKCCDLACDVRTTTVRKL